MGLIFSCVCSLLLKVQQGQSELTAKTSLQSVLTLRLVEKRQKYKEVVLISTSIGHRGPPPIPSEVKLSLAVELSLVAEMQDQSMEKE